LAGCKKPLQWALAREAAGWLQPLPKLALGHKAPNLYDPLLPLRIWLSNNSLNNLIVRAGGGYSASMDPHMHPQVRTLREQLEEERQALAAREVRTHAFLEPFGHLVPTVGCW